MTDPLEINFLGTLLSPTSWAHVTREMLLALHMRRHDISVTNCRGFLHDKHFRIPWHFNWLMSKPLNMQFEIAFEYPPNYHKLMAETRIGMLVYETTVLPPQWRDAILEAFACGKPAIVTGWGGQLEFCDKSNAYLIDHSIVPAEEIQYDNDSADALIALPDVDHLRSLCGAHTKTLRHWSENPKTS